MGAVQSGLLALTPAAITSIAPSVDSPSLALECTVLPLPHLVLRLKRSSHVPRNSVP